MQTIKKDDLLAERADLVVQYEVSLVVVVNVIKGCDNRRIDVLDTSTWLLEAVTISSLTPFLEATPSQGLPKAGFERRSHLPRKFDLEIISSSADVGFYL